MKKLLFILLALPTLLTAQEKPVQVPTSEGGKAFTIRIPVKFPPNTTVQYAWYRNDTLIDDTHTLLLGERAIAYTVPTDKAFGSAVYHFKYNLHDDHDGKWTRSPRYLVTFQTIASPPIPDKDECGIAVVGAIEDKCIVAAGAIDDKCTGITAAGAIDDKCAGITAAGAIDDKCAGITAAGAIDDKCAGITTAGSIR